MLQPFFLVIYV